MIYFYKWIKIAKEKIKRIGTKKCIIVLSFIFLGLLYLKNASVKKEEAPVAEPVLSSSTLPTMKLYYDRAEDVFLNYSPKIDVYNLFDEKNKEGQSIGDQFYKEMMSMDSRYLASITDEAGETPEKVAKSLGIKRSRIMGKYNPAIQGENENRSASYPVAYFKNIHYRFLNGDGQEIEDSSNVKDILAMVSVYSYKHNYLDIEHFKEICQELYLKSHSYSLSISPVYYDDGCVNLSAKEEAENAGGKSVEEIQKEEKQTEGMEETKKDSTESASETQIGKEAERQEEKLSGKQIEDGNVAEKEKPEETVLSNVSLESSASTENTEESSALDPTEEANKERKEGENDSAKVSPSEMENGSAKKAKKTTGSSEKKRLPKNYCPGHVDLTITIQVKKFGDQNGLKEIILDSLKKDEPFDNMPSSRWKGWNEECINAVNQLIDTDWFNAYGLSLSTVETKMPLSEEEISRYMSMLPENLSAERKNVIYYALSAVGKVPYYYGGKAAKQGLDGNQFGKTVGRDYKGRNKKGLDCSGFVQWAYWSGAENPLDFASSTKELVGKGNKIKRSELIPGDLVIQPSGESHVVMFLAWTEEGQMLAIHENSTAGTVSVDEVSANYPYYRSILP